MPSSYPFLLGSPYGNRHSEIPVKSVLCSLKQLEDFVLPVTWSPGACTFLSKSRERTPLRSKLKGTVGDKEGCFGTKPSSPTSHFHSHVYKMSLEEHTRDCVWWLPLEWGTRDKCGRKVNFSYILLCTCSVSRSLHANVQKIDGPVVKLLVFNVVWPRGYQLQLLGL